MWYQKVLKPVLFQLEPERAHDLAYALGKIISDSDAACSFLSTLFHADLNVDPVSCWGVSFPNRIGLAAGFDKNGHLIPIMKALGFGFVEIGSITAMPSAGNPKPRMFRLPEDHALVNRMGLNNDGAVAICNRLMNRPRPDIPIGVNIAKTHNPVILGKRALEDYRISFRQARKVADYITINISCPNTEEGKTFEDPAALHALLNVLMAEPRRRQDKAIPILVKLSADLSMEERAELVAICEQFGIDGYVAVNTSSQRSGLVHSHDADIAKISRGGLSGTPLLDRACSTISHLKSLTGGSKHVIGVGGVCSLDDATRMREAGADLIQTYTGLVYQGPAFPSLLAREIH